MTLNINNMRAVELRITENDGEAGFTKPNGN
ncbi:Uncharacterised protein [Clostridium sporogenes]|uniref:Uncharacterized protein n=1 Tax=Clostridium sporogenes TaxID=1509 RepID=A0A7U4LNU9_CLOSG|nr:hypothetical protein T258_1583 [Clostridium botulinum Prevot_594]AKC63624.1 hypothetical protein CLSPO_c29040 [Clostridium sporogenes]STC82562.1 Uncharacterised protein [Clostridium botulinum]KCZ67322.1 hypothetical protein CSPO_9c03370 [Clostridium sporogenes]KRU38050.1 hypothetical protein VT94_31220 [Clostridium sporogenes]